MKTFLLTALFAIATLSAACAFDPLKTISTGQGAGKIEWSIELASDDASRSKGLMFRKTMQPLHGMLFRFEAVRPVSMWMKNTFIPLDMVFMDEQGSVTHIHLGAVPHSLDIISSNGPAKFVLEINAGEATKQGLQIGQKFFHPWFRASN